MAHRETQPQGPGETIAGSRRAAAGQVASGRPAAAEALELAAASTAEFADVSLAAAVASSCSQFRVSAHWTEPVTRFRGAELMGELTEHSGVMLMDAMRDQQVEEPKPSDSSETRLLAATIWRNPAVRSYKA